MTHRVIYSSYSACVAMIGTGAGQAIDKDMHVSIGTIIAIGAIVFPLTWKLKGWMDKMDSRQERIEEIVKNLPCKKESAGCKEKGQ